MNDAANTISGPHFFVTSEGSLHGEDTPENRELIRRIHACVNACEGITTDELEAGIIDDMRKVIAEVAPLFEKVAEEQAKPTIAAPHMKRRETVATS